MLGRRRLRRRLLPLVLTDVISGVRALRVAVGAVESSLGGGSPSRGSHGAAACGAALALLWRRLSRAAALAAAWRSAAASAVAARSRRSA